MGHIPLSSVEEPGGAVKAAPVENSSGECVEPSLETVQDGSYNPLGRQLYVYPSAASLDRPEVLAFLEFFIERNEEITTGSVLHPAERGAEGRGPVQGRRTLRQLTPVRSGAANVPPRTGPPDLNDEGREPELHAHQHEGQGTRDT